MGDWRHPFRSAGSGGSGRQGAKRLRRVVFVCLLGAAALFGLVCVSGDVDGGVALLPDPDAPCLREQASCSHRDTVGEPFRSPHRGHGDDVPARGLLAAAPGGICLLI